MERTNFQLAELIYLVQGDEWYDLHSGYKFTGLQYDPRSQGVVLSWARGRWGGPSQPAKLALRFSGVDHFSVHPRDPELPYTEDTSLAEVAYLSPEDLSENELGRMGMEEQATDQSFLIFHFQSEQKIVVRSQQVSLHVFEQPAEV
ncbi:hypothetical protein [Deinococcus humi]|uniref:Uncharacterized protein n=1 Tax=Deinococcus humi TaxID=662880 RepID=A0A7W8K2J6_9DEIO|nr:hypothetical protein [Deinococcus humi]MBB5366114.1 hypothetical protein [Deinococcus humi]GGO41991.1 hypothetical protein GCM10008949_53540 [Deinococcus humi]